MRRKEKRLLGEENGNGKEWTSITKSKLLDGKKEDCEVIYIL